MKDQRYEGVEPGAVSRRDWILSVCSGALLALTFPLPGLSFLAWIAFVPLLFAVSGKKPSDAFKLGFISGLCANLGILYWLNIVMTTYGKLHWSVSAVLYIVLSAFLALYTAAAVYFTRRGEMRGLPPLLSFPVVWVALELARAYLLTGFPWEDLGYSQYRILPLIQIADITGVYGLSFLIVFTNVVIFGVIRSLFGTDRKPYPTKGVALLLLLLTATLAYGFRQLSVPERGDLIKVGLTQGNIPQDVKWNPSFQEQTIEIYEKLSRQSCAGGCDLVVWPESAAPFFFQSDTPHAARIKSLAAELKTCMLIGSPAYENESSGPHYFNSAYLLDSNGEVLGRSDKVHLVPFGEYVPLAKLLPFVNKLVEGIGDFSPGKTIAPLNTGKGKIGVLVCFEGIFPDISRDYVREGSRMLVNITNDAWFGRSSAPYQHLSMTAFRAVENRVPLVRSANTGISAIIDSKGYIRRMTPIFTETYLTGEVHMGEGGSFYTRFGDLFAYICLAAAVLMGVLMLKRVRKPAI